MCSFSHSPVPTPRKNRPPRIAELVAAAWATMVGWLRRIGHVTPVPIATRVVRIATPPIVVHTNGL